MEKRAEKKSYYKIHHFILQWLFFKKKNILIPLRFVEPGKIQLDSIN